MTRAYTETRKLVITSTTDSIDGVGALTISSGGENTNVNLAPTGEGTVDVNSKKITRLAAPTSDSDAATKAYVDATKQGLDVKDSVRVSTTANITLSGTQSVDGVNVIAGDRVLVKNQTTGSENGIYVVAAGAWARAVDANSDADVTTGMFCFVSEGTSNGDSGYVLTTNDAITLGTTALSFTQFSGAGQVGAGDGLTKTGNTLDVVGTADRITVNADSVDIASTYAGQSSITTLGTVATGTWQATAVAVAYGGTGATTAGGAASNLGLGTEDSPSFTAVTLSANTVSSDTTSGALVVTGGVGVGGAMNIGGALDVNAAASANSMSVTDATASTSTSTGAMVVTGGVGVGGAMNVGGALDVNAAASVNSMSVTDATASTSTSTGAMVVTGGVGVGGAMNIGGATKVTDSTASTSTSTGALVVTGGVGVGGAMNIGGATKVADNTASTSTSTGAMVVTGGVGVGGTIYATQVNAGNIQAVTNTISATNADGSIFLAPLGTGTVDVSSKRITNLASPSGDNDAATKAYVDAVKQGLDVKDSVRVATTANITLSGTQSVDGVNVIAGDRVLVKNQTTGSENGIYVVAAGAWARAVDANSDADVTTGMFCFVSEGTSNGDSGYVLTTNDAITLGTTALSFTQFSGAGQVGAGDGLTKTGNTLDVVGTADRITVNADSVDIASTYAGQSSITTLGTVGTGTWQATTVAVEYGGTGATTGGDARTNLGIGEADIVSFGSVSLSDATASTNTSTGAMVVTGGVGIGGAMNIGGAVDVNSSLTANSMSVDGNFNTGVTLGTNAFPTGKISVRSAIVDLKTVADTTIFTVPTGYMFLVDTMEIVTTSVTSPSAAPVVQFGNGGDGDAYYGPNQVTSNSVGARHIIENPQDGVVAGTAVAFGVTTASTASAHSGVGIVTGYLMKTA